jgi:hypothetical protein
MAAGNRGSESSSEASRDQIAKAKAAGVYRGSPASIDAAQCNDGAKGL